MVSSLQTPQHANIHRVVGHTQNWRRSELDARQATAMGAETPTSTHTGACAHGGIQIKVAFLAVQQKR